MDRSHGLLEEASSMIYKEAGRAMLQAYLFTPSDYRDTDERTAVVFFSAGLWDNALISQFAPHCLHFRERGAVAVIFEYREISKHGVSPLEAIKDGRSAMRWLRMNASELGVHPDRITAVGASGGAHLCLAAAMLDDQDEEGEPTDISCVPNAMVLFSPVVNTTKKGVGFDKFPDAKVAKVTSPSQNVRRGLPPTLVFQGLSDRVVAPDLVLRFCKAMKRKKNRCDLVTYPREGHSFFNFNVSMQHFESTINTMDRFLVDLDFLPVNEEDDGSNRLAS